MAVDIASFNVPCDPDCPGCAGHTERHAVDRRSPQWLEYCKADQMARDQELAEPGKYIP